MEFLGNKFLLFAIAKNNLSAVAEGRFLYKFMRLLRALLNFLNQQASDRNRSTSNKFIKKMQNSYLLSIEKTTKTDATKPFIRVLKKIIQVSLIFIFLFTGTTKAQNTTFSGTNGAVWNDTQNVKIQAHGGQVQKIGAKWWWVGENRNGNRNICIYSSDDLYNWKNEGYAMRTVDTRSQLDTDPYFTALYGNLTTVQKDAVYAGIQSNKVIERPKIIYNKKTNKYILWFHADDSNYGAAAAGVAVSSSITGPYTFIKRSRLHQLPSNEYGTEWYEAIGNRGFARDMNLFVDDDDTAYIVYSSEENRTMFISRLNADYTDLDVSQTPVGLAKNGLDFIRLFPGAQREAPAMFKYNKKYYMITSGATGWDANPAQYWVADEIFGEWKNMGDPCISEPNIPYPANLTFGTQSTYIIPLDPANGKFIYMGDRWNSSNLSDSRYVWLPMYITPSGNIELKNTSNWELSLFDTINDVRFSPTLFNQIYYQDSELPSSFDAEIRTPNGWENNTLAIDWNTSITDLPPASLSNFSGTFIANGLSKTLAVQAVNIPNGLLYFIDSGATVSSDLYDAIKVKKLAPNLINTNTYDQAFSQSRGWGYSGIVGTDIDYKNSDSKDSFTSGWWGYTNKPIDYKLRVTNDDYRLTVGIQEWWSANRSMSISINYQNTQGVSSTKTLGTFTNNTQTTQDYTFKLDDLNAQNPYITIRIEKTNSNDPDPVVSWLALTSLNLNTMSLSDSILASRSIVLYPNPAMKNQTVYLETNSDGSFLDDTTISIYSSSGQIVSTCKTTGKQTAIDISSLSSGIYIVKHQNNFVKLIIK